MQSIRVQDAGNSVLTDIEASVHNAAHTSNAFSPPFRERPSRLTKREEEEEEEEGGGERGSAAGAADRQNR